MSSLQNTEQKSSIKKGDTVMVIAGRERGKMGKVLAVYSQEGRVTVEKLAMIKRHTKPTQKNRQGGILEREGPIALSNVMLYCQNCKKRTRVGYTLLDAGGKVRVCRKCREVLDQGS